MKRRHNWVLLAVACVSASFWPTFCWAQSVDASGVWVLTAHCPISMIHTVAKTPFGDISFDTPMDLSPLLSIAGPIIQSADGTLSDPQAITTNSPIGTLTVGFSGNVSGTRITFDRKTTRTATNTDQVVTAHYTGTVAGDGIKGTVDAIYSEVQNSAVPGVSQMVSTATASGAFDVQIHRLTNGYILTGYVRQKTTDGAAAPGIEVRLTAGGMPARGATTDISGHFEFTGLPAGVYIAMPAKIGLLFQPADQTVSLKQDTELSVFVALEIPALTITPIWSDQYPGQDHNGLPVDPSLNRGAGDLGNQSGLILMAARNDGMAYVRAEVALVPPDSPLHDKVRLQLVTSSPDQTVLAVSGLSENIVGFQVPFKGVELECGIVGWVDIDGDGAITPASGETMSCSAGRFAIVGIEGYKGAIGELRTWTAGVLAGAVLPIAYRFLDAFLNHTTPGKAVEVKATLIHPDRDLSHNVGLVMNADGTALLRQYEFSSASDVAQKVLASLPMKSAMVSTLAWISTENHLPK